MAKVYILKYQRSPFMRYIWDLTQCAWPFQSVVQSSKVPCSNLMKEDVITLKMKTLELNFLYLELKSQNYLYGLSFNDNLKPMHKYFYFWLA